MANGGTWYRGNFYPSGTPINNAPTYSKPAPSSTPSQNESAPLPVSQLTAKNEGEQTALTKLQSGVPQSQLTDVERLNVSIMVNRLRSSGGGGSTISSPSTSPTPQEPTPKSISAANPTIFIAGDKPSFAEKAFSFGKEKSEMFMGSVNYYINAVTPNRKVETQAQAFQNAFTPSIPQATATGMGGTAEFRTPKLEEMTPEQAFSFRATQAQVKAYSSQYIFSKQLQSTYQEKINLGQLSAAEAQTAMNKEMAAYSSNINSKFQKEIAAANYQYGSSVGYKEVPYTFFKGIAYGAIGAIALPVGLTLTGIGLGYAGFHYKEIGKQFMTYPKQALANVGAGFAGAALGSLGVSALKARYENYMFERELNRAQIKVAGYQISTPKGATATKFESAPFEVRGTTIQYIGKQTMPSAFPDGRSVGSLTIIQKLTTNGKTTLRIYEGVPTIRGFETGRLLTKSGTISGEEWNYFVGKTNLQLTYETTTSKYFFNLFSKTKATSYDNKPFVKTEFGGRAMPYETYLTKGFLVQGGKSGRFFKITDEGISPKVIARGNIKATIYQISSSDSSTAYTKIFGGSGGSFQQSFSPTPSIQSQSSLLKEFTRTTAKPQNIPAIAFPISQVQKSFLKETAFATASSALQLKSLQITQTRTALFSGVQTMQLTKTTTTTKFVDVTPRVSSGSSTATFQLIAPTQTQVVVPAVISQSRGASLAMAFPFITGGVGFPFILPKNNFDFRMRTRNIIGRKQRKKYTPSYEALVFNIRGKRPKGRETGIRIRPITKNFKWSFGKIKI